LNLCIAATFIALAFAYRIYLIELKKKKLQRDYTQQLEQELAARTIEIEAQSRSIEAKNRQQLKTEFERKLAETEMAALRAQMNPHFIFNCLTSIQFFTAQNDAESASNYLTKFSRLIRLVLENSRSERVTLANELETLRLYIDMEAMRFQHKVRYKISVDKGIMTDTIQLPPMLLQPFVENAIWHGLMHKAEGGLVEVVVQQPTDHLLHVEITDDGIGRVKATEYKSKSATKNKSFGMNVTAARIELINQLYNTNNQVSIIDMVAPSGEAMGTRVIVEIPI
jgi:LytS/YehU family sensor histidine kinase